MGTSTRRRAAVQDGRRAAKDLFPFVVAECGHYWRRRLVVGLAIARGALRRSRFAIVGVADA